MSMFHSQWKNPIGTSAMQTSGSDYRIPSGTRVRRIALHATGGNAVFLQTFPSSMSTWSVFTRGGATGRVGAGLQCAYITVLPQARDAEGLQEITATQEQDAQLYRRQTGRRKETRPQ